MDAIAENKQKFIDLYKAKITRTGSEKLLDWLTNNTDFFEAPASTRFHSAHRGGLCEHSLNVYSVLSERCSDESEEAVAIVALLHDLCKVNFYKLSSRNVKNPQTGVWEPVPYYTIEDQFPFGHGEKSVYLIERFMRLKTVEAVAIRWHMGGYDDNAKAGGYTVSAAFSQYPLAVYMHIADVEATYLMETQNG